MTLVVATEDPAGPDVVTMLEAADAYFAALYPAEHNYLLDVTALKRPEIVFLTARHGGTLVGTGAVVDCGDYAELKRMWVAPEARGRAVGRAILEALEAHARGLGRSVACLETGVKQHAARRLYQAAGYREIAPFGNYAESVYSLFMEKRLGG